MSPPLWSNDLPPEPPSAQQHDIYAARLVEDSDSPVRHARYRLISGIATGLRILTRRVSALFISDSASSNRTGITEGAVGDAGTLAASAVTGKLEGASLEGELKRAEISRMYADARKANAEASKIESDQAWADVERTIRLAQLLGGTVELTRLPDGTPCLTIGDILKAQSQDLRISKSDDQLPPANLPEE